MMNLFDVIIVGGGPAGATACYTLARHGLHVLIIDQSIFPRRKVCGGGLTIHARNEIPFDISDVIHQEVRSGQIGFRGQIMDTISDNAPIAFMIDRPTFDSFLLEKAVEQGAITRLGQRVKSISTKSEIIQVQTNQESFFCKFLIGADGVHSIIAKQSGLIKNRATSLAYEARLSRARDLKSSSSDMITFDFGTIPFGYGWIFPKKDHLNVGVCRTWPGNKASRKHLLRFINQHPGLHQNRIIDIRAFPVPLGGKKHNLHKNNLLLVGDAANLADPWLGEGLYYALYSGRLGAETIIRHLDGELTDLTAYTRKINRTCIEDFTYAKRFSLLVNILPYINVLLLKSSRTLQQLVIDLLCGDLTYHQAWQSLLKKSPGLLWNKISGKG